jgi:hypothetical protein
MSTFKDVTGYDSFTDMIDGGGAGGSGDSFYSGSNEDYVTTGGTDTGQSPFSNERHDDGGYGSSNTNSGSGNVGGADVTYTGTPGEGNFFVKDESFIDPYEYLELIGGDYDSDGNWTFDNEDGSTVYSDNAAFDMSHYVKNEDHAADVKFYNENPNSTITTEQYTQARKISRGLAIVAGPLGLGSRVIIELQRRGKLPGNTATSWFEKNDVPDQTGSSNDDKILSLIESGASDAEIEEALQNMISQEEIEGITAAVGAMSESAFGDSSVDSENSELFSDTALSDKVGTIDTTNTNIDTTKYEMGDGFTSDLSQVDGAETVDAPESKGPAEYTADTVSDKIGTPETTVDAVTGTIDSDNLVDPDLIDIDETASGLNAVGKALNDFAKVDISKVIDTSTVQGKLLADKLGEGGYVDSKSTILGQMKIISDEFKDSNGNPRIPAWAQGVARNTSRSIAFGGMSGTAATAAMANAIMEASLGVAEKEASFFQTLTVENLNNKQEALINKASVLANFELANLDVKSQAAIENARAFLQMDLKNLDNEQQAEVLNTQIRVDALFEDTKAKNTERLYTAEATNDMNKFYDELSAQVDMHRADSINNINKFNVGEANDNSQFQTELDSNRDTFYKELQWNVDKAIFEWNQTITLEEFRTKFEAAKFDTQNMFDLTTEKLNRIWDREDAYFDYVWKSAETEKERLVDLYEIDKEYEVEMRKTVNDENYKKGQADWELFKWGADILGLDDDFDILDIV